MYRIAVSAEDELGLTCEGTLSVAVPHDRAHAAVDSFPLNFDSTPP